MTRQDNYHTNQKSCTAYHEAGHAVAAVLAFRFACTPNTRPPLPVKIVNIFEEEAGWAGECFGPDIYSTAWPVERITHAWRDAMEWQIIINMAGPIAEAIYRGEKRKSDVLWFAVFYCGARQDVDEAGKVINDLRKLTGRNHGEQRFAERARDLLLNHWPLVDAIAEALIRDHSVVGEEIEEMIALGWREEINVYISGASR